jgi:hypothetical protein
VRGDPLFHTDSAVPAASLPIVRRYAEVRIDQFTEQTPAGSRILAEVKTAYTFLLAVVGAQEVARAHQGVVAVARKRPVNLAFR